MRMAHEASLYSGARGSVFITLTYRDKAVATPEQLAKGYHIRDDWSLDKAPNPNPENLSSHFQKFMKRLRKSDPRKKAEEGERSDAIRYFQCGEYGSKCKHGFDLEKQTCPLCNVGRPHHHAILFNKSFGDLEQYAVQNGVVRMTSPELASHWRYGFVDVGEVTMQSAAYVARYCMKKITGVQAEEHYRSVDIHGEVTDLEPEYATMSNGIGRDWYEKYKTDVFPSDEVPVPGQGVYKKVPRYYDEVLREEDPKTFEEIKARREAFMAENGAEYTPERLYEKYQVKKAQTNQLKRTL